MGSDAGTVDDYLDEIPLDRQSCLQAIRAACKELLTGFDESIVYGMPAYSRNGEVEVAFANRKRYMAVYILRTDVLNAYRDQLPGIDVGKGCVRYRRSSQVDQAVLRSMLTATAATTGPVC